MGNLTSASITIYFCPPHRVRAVLDAIEDVQGFDSDPAARKTLELRVPYEIESIHTHDCADVARSLRDVAPEAVFTMIEEPAYEGLGTLALYAPGLGLNLADCNVGGAALFTPSEILAMDNDDPEVRAEKLGVPWLKAIEELSEEPDPVEPEPLLTTWDRARGEIVVFDGKVCGGDVLLAVEPIGGDGAASGTLHDTKLADLGFLRTTPWTELDAPPHLRRTYVYRRPAPPHDS